MKTFKFEVDKVIVLDDNGQNEDIITLKLENPRTGRYFAAGGRTIGDALRSLSVVLDKALRN